MAAAVDFVINIKDELTPKLDEMSAKVKELQSQMGNLKAGGEKSFGGIKEGAGEGIGELTKMAGAVGLAIAAFEGIKKVGEAAFDFMKDAVADTIKLTQAQSGLTRVLENNGQGKMLGALKEQTEELFKHSEYSKAELYQAQARIAMTGISLDSQKKANQALVDYAALSKQIGRDIGPAQAARSFEKALISVKGAQMLLKEVGVGLTKAEKERLQHLQDSGNMLKYQAFLIDTIQGKVRGAAQAALDNDPFAKWNKGLEEIKEKVGPLGVGFIKAIEPLTDDLLKGLDAIAQWFVDHKKDFKEWIDAIVKPLHESIDWLSTHGVFASAQDKVYKDLMVDAYNIDDQIKDLQKVSKDFSENQKNYNQFSQHKGGITGQTFAWQDSLREHAATKYLNLMHQGETADSTIAELREKRKAIEEFARKQAYGDKEKTSDEKGVAGKPGTPVLEGTSVGAGYHPTQIFFNIDKFGNFEIKTVNMTESAVAVKDLLMQAIEEAVNDAQNIAKRN